MALNCLAFFLENRVLCIGVISFGALGHVPLPLWLAYMYTDLAISIYISPVGSGDR